MLMALEAMWISLTLTNITFNFNCFLFIFFNRYNFYYNSERYVTILSHLDHYSVNHDRKYDYNQLDLNMHTYMHT